MGKRDGSFTVPNNMCFMSPIEVDWRGNRFPHPSAMQKSESQYEL